MSNEFGEFMELSDATDVDEVVGAVNQMLFSLANTWQAEQAKRGIPLWVVEGPRITVDGRRITSFVSFTDEPGRRGVIVGDLFVRFVNMRTAESVESNKS